MQIGLPSLGAHLQKGLRSLYAVHGDEVLLQLEAVDAIRGLGASGKRECYRTGKTGNELWRLYSVPAPGEGD